MRRLIGESVEFPVTHDSLIGQLGEVKLVAPTGETVLASEVLNRVGEAEYGSAGMLYTSIVGNLDDSFIGRKYSDEREGAHTCPDPKCSTRQSF